MEVYFLMNKVTVRELASYFEVSVGLASENLSLGRMINANTKLLQCKTRKEALRKCKYIKLDDLWKLTFERQTGLKQKR